MSSIIEANAYAQSFEASDATITNSSALVAFLVVMTIAALAGVVFTAPIVTIAAGLITAVAVPAIALSAIDSDN
ncbi:hypothetical protein EJ997_07615 [Flaviflexus ciconiae]|uniref:Uncharacterized protein n=1 Tax=Flaviflexus ciconiae TaxID=2496867 RepID=A0A3S9PXT6_9ACTO|nr:hypothetical protein [Flaviflexus ciconiae]AZQ77220.1 hypothetical protein EJ997_07615 [Flaviflexus ciconiae]